MVIKEADCKHPRRVCVRVCLPGVTSVGEVELEVSRVRWPRGKQGSSRDSSCVHPSVLYIMVTECL